MKLINKWGYRVYRTFAEIPVAVTIMQVIYHKFFPLINPVMRSYRYRPNREKPLEKCGEIKKDLKQLTIAIVCDEMTFKGFEQECNCVFVTPSNWMSIFREIKPDLFFCESAWSGIDRYPNCWRGKIYKSGKARFENRKDLKNILDFCRKSHIPTVFWNKEDPTYFGDKDHDFVDTALLFDYIYTTAEECIDKYKELGHTQVKKLMFGFSPKLFNPLNRNVKLGNAVFAGSWYQNQSQRCMDMREIFDIVINSGLSLKIYDRHWNSENPINEYPEQYKKYLHQGVSFEELNEVLKTAQFGININTVKDSRTMFARRVFEMMASNLMIISNESSGLKEMFNRRIWFANEITKPEKIDEICRSNLKEVFLHHTCRHRLLQVATEVGVLEEQHMATVFIIYNEVEHRAQEHFNNITYDKKQGLIFKDGEFYKLIEKTYFDIDCIGDDAFIIWLSSQDKEPDLEFMITQFSYIDKTFGIREGEPRYSFKTDTQNEQTLFHISMFKQINKNGNESINKYLI